MISSTAIAAKEFQSFYSSHFFIAIQLALPYFLRRRRTTFHSQSIPASERSRSRVELEKPAAIKASARVEFLSIKANKLARLIAGQKRVIRRRPRSCLFVVSFHSLIYSLFTCHGSSSRRLARYLKIGCARAGRCERTRGPIYSFITITDKRYNMITYTYRESSSRQTIVAMSTQQTIANSHTITYARYLCSERDRISSKPFRIANNLTKNASARLKYASVVFIRSQTWPPEGCPLIRN